MGENPRGSCPSRTGLGGDPWRARCSRCPQRHRRERPGRLHRQCRRTAADRRDRRGLPARARAVDLAVLLFEGAEDEAEGPGAADEAGSRPRIREGASSSAVCATVFAATCSRRRFAACRRAFGAHLRGDDSDSSAALGRCLRGIACCLGASRGRRRPGSGLRPQVPFGRGFAGEGRGAGERPLRSRLPRRARLRSVGGLSAGPSGGAASALWRLRGLGHFSCRLGRRRVLVFEFDGVDWFWLCGGGFLPRLEPRFNTIELEMPSLSIRYRSCAGGR